MTAEQTATLRPPQQARRGRRTLVAADLADLHGPTSGQVELPLRLFWYPDRTFDLDAPGMRDWLYQTVLREATRPEDLTAFLDGDTLIARWPELFLPRDVRAAWEDRQPALRAASAAAAIAV
ncbi:MAG TPA: hypothetical protein VN847_12175 [Streptosporangiaceae bacterium]|nr:hypothetical protein [Streptosporangiaceae bacterium]